MEISVKCLYEFGPFLLDPREGRLLHKGQQVPITPKAFQLLVFLVQRDGHLVEKTELLEELWHGSVVEDGNLTVTISVLRKALHEDHGVHKYIETVSKRGYRFVAQVRQVGEPASAPTRSPADEPLEIRPELQTQADWVPEARDGAIKSGEKLLAVPSLPVNSTPTRTSRRNLVAAIFSLGISLGILLALFGVISRRGGRTAQAQPSARIRSLAVLPFQILGDQSGAEYFGVGLADVLITRLGNTGKIIVRPTTSIQKYVGAAMSPQAAGAEQGVDAVVSGTVQRQSSRVRLTIRLIGVRDGVQLWGDTFDETSTNTFDLEDALSERVAQSIPLKLSEEEALRLIKRPTERRDAYESYIKGRYFWNKRTEKDIEKGLEYFRQAIALDPKFAEAYVGIADSYCILGFYAVLPPKQAFPAAKEATKRALELDDGLAEAHATLGFINFFYDWNGAEATKEFQRALGENPNYAMAHSWFGISLAARGMYVRANAEAERAIAYDPLSPVMSSHAGWVVSLSGNADQAIEILKKSIEIEPNFARAHLRLGRAYEQKHSYEMAISELEKAVNLSGEEPCSKGSLGHAYAISGKTDRAMEILQDLEGHAGQRYVPAYAIALIYSGLGDKEHAMAWLQKAYEDRSTAMAFVRTDPELSGLHSDPRFEELSRRVGF